MLVKKYFWKKKKILITGHTGFKGSWLSLILHYLGSNINGYALDPLGKKNIFNLLSLKEIFKKDYRKDITNLSDLKKSIKNIQPEIIFHLAAQPNVIESFKDPNKTVRTNVIGTANVLEAIKNQKSVKCVIIVTTDKVYQNYKEQKYFNEKSALGGDDVYSGSKACCEILTNSYVKSFFSDKKVKIATVRAGNCIGGGDWTKNRIVKDCLEAFFRNKKLTIRSPNAQRPWQHVIEPLVGYLLLCQKLCTKEGKNFLGAWNFGPNSRQNMKVIKLAKMIKETVNSNSKIIIKNNSQKNSKKKTNIFESKYLNINSKKALTRLKWRSKLTINSSVKLTVDWHKALISKTNLIKFSLDQIKQYITTK